jgi:hypothetical protein
MAHRKNEVSRDIGIEIAARDLAPWIVESRVEAL